MSEECRKKIVEALGERHECDYYRYTTCVNNGCWDAACVLKCGVKDGKVVSIETDDTINKNAGREDVSEEALKTGMIQLRACPMGHAWRKELDTPTRLLHPMKRVGGKGAGNGHFEQISWDEALDTIAEKMKEISEKYGDASIAYCQYSAFERSDLPLAPWLRGALATWGDHSTSGQHAGEEFHAGVDLVDVMFKGKSVSFPGFEAPDLLNSDLIILWGFDPLVGWFGTVPYYMKLAQERGCKVICIEPRYTVSAEVLADQWIPIRPGTDMALQLAMAYVLYDEDLIDHEFVDKYVEPEGFETWRKYVMGETDGEPKTPEWAAPITSIPAETIYELARLYGKSKAVHLQAHYSIAKRNLGDYAGAGAMLLQAMTGNIAKPGGCESGCCLCTLPHVDPPAVDWGRAPADYFPPVVCNNNKITEAIYCRPLYDAGLMTEEEYRNKIGNPPGAPLPNIHMLIMDNNYANNQHNANKRMRGYNTMDFSWGWQWHEGQPSAEFLDIVLPAPIHQFETMDTYFFGQERMFLAPSGFRNYFVYCDKIVDPPEEVRPKEWVWMQIAKRLGIGEKYSARLCHIDDPDEWTEAVRDLYKEAYENWRARSQRKYKRKFGIELLPWDEFLENPVVHVPMDEPFYPFKNVIEAGESPFITPSGKFEFDSNYVKQNPLPESKYRGHYNSYPVWQPDYQDVPANDSYYHPKTGEYPLSLVTPVTSYRQHSANDLNPWMRDDVYKHAVWINPADAVSRGISDGDTCVVYNEYGEVHIPAFVTSRTVPGTVSIHHGSWYRPSEKKTDLMPFGVDEGGNCNLLIGDTHLPHIVGALLTAGLVQVKKLGGE